MLHKNIVRLRKSKGLTQVEFAKLMHVSQSAVSHWESGRSMPDTVQLFQIAQFFNMSIEELSNGKPPEGNPKPSTQPTQKAPADMRAEAKALLEGLSDEGYRAALEHLKLLKRMEEQK